ncbi:MAG: phage minor capsid protein [Lachnospiraceae bacterium]
MRALTPEQIDILVDKYIIGLYQEMEREIIADIARRIKKTGRYTETAELMAKSMVEQGYSASKIQAEVMKLLRADKAYQMAVAENTKAYKRNVQEIIDKTLEEANKGNKELIAGAANMAWNNDLSMWQEHGVDLKEPNTMSQLMTAFQIQTAKELKNITRTTGFKNTVLGTTGVLNAYQKELDLAVLKIATGTFSYDQAVNDCVKRLAVSGLRSIDYANGRSYQIDTAVRMAARTGVSQLSGRITEMNLKSTGQDLVIVSQHMGSRPEHAPIQNKVFSYSGKNKKYPSFQAPIGSGGAGYGMADGIKGVNCTHDFYPYWEGDAIPKDIEYDERYYKNTQKQRAMERNIRATKREIEAQKAIGGETKELQAKLRKQVSDYYSFSDSVGIRAKDNRLRVVSSTSSSNKAKEREIKRGEDNVVKSTGNATIKISKEKKVEDVHLIGKIDKNIYKCITEDIVTDEVIITDERIRHIKARHPNDYESFCGYLKDIIEQPQYIVETQKPNTALILNEVIDGKEQFKTVLRLTTSCDNPEFKNSIITFMKINEKEWSRILRNKKILYKKE